MHFLGGLLIGLIILKVFFSGKRFNFAHLHKVFITLIVLLGVLFIGGFWEVFEYGVGLTPIYNLTTFDTASDLVFDLAGAFAAVWWYFKKVWHVG